jgi:hypothetical protein
MRCAASVPRFEGDLLGRRERRFDPFAEAKTVATAPAPWSTCVPNRESHQKQRPRPLRFPQRIRGLQMVGETGFEPATPWSRTGI